MGEISLKSIKYESIKSIFASIADSEKISRADISKLTGLSLVTVGKIADALLDSGMICQVKEVRAQAGRRAGVLSVNEAKFMLIIDLTSFCFKAFVLDLRMHQSSKISFDYKGDLLFSENMNRFLGEVAVMISKKYDTADCIGIGVSVAGSYNTDTDTAVSTKLPELSSVKLRSTIAKYFPEAEIIIDSHTNTAAKYNVTHTEKYKEKSIVYWYVGSDYISGAYIVDGVMMQGKDGRTCDFGSLLQFEDLTLEDKVKMAKDQNTCAEALSGSIFNVMKILNPHTVIMEFDTDYSTDGILPIIKDLLMKKYRIKRDEMPEFIKAFAGVRSSHRGLALNLRELWLDKIVFSQ